MKAQLTALVLADMVVVGLAATAAQAEGGPSNVKSAEALQNPTGCAMPSVRYAPDRTSGRRRRPSRHRGPSTSRSIVASSTRCDGRCTAPR